MSSQFYRSSSMSRTLPDINSHRPLSASNHVTFSNDFDQYNRRNTMLNNYSSFDKDQWADKSRFEGARSQNEYHKPFDSTLSYVLEPSSQMKDLISTLNERDHEIWELRCEVETTRKKEVQLQSTIQRLQRQVLMMENEQTFNLKGEYLNEAYKNSQDDNREFKNRIIELEDRLRLHLEERERSDQERMGCERKLKEMTKNLCSLLYLEAGGTSINGMGLPNSDKILDDIIKKVEEVMQDNAMLKGVHVNLKDQVTRLEGQEEEHKETILRLSGEIEKQQQFVSKCTLEVENMKVEKDRALTVREEQEKECATLRERLETLHNSWEKMKGELEEGRGSRRVFEAERIRDGLLGENDAYRYKSLKESLSKMLNADEMFEKKEIGPKEEEILTALNDIIVQKLNYKATIENDWKMLKDLTVLTEDLCDKLKSESFHNRDMIFEIQETVEKIKNARNRQASSFDSLELKDRKLRLALDQIGNSLLIPKWSLGTKVDEMINEIIVCIERLIEKVENKGIDRDDMKDKHILNLQRKVKSLKEQAEKKDRQIDILKDNLSDNDQDQVRIRGTEKLVEKYRCELKESHMKIRELRQQVFELSSIKSEINEEREMINNVENEIEKHKRDRKDKQLVIQQLEMQCQKMRNHLRNTKLTLAKVNSEYKKLVELRCVMAGMLGITTNNATIDFEILTRVEQLILACSNQAANSLLIDPGRSINMTQRYKRSQMNNATRDGYQTDGYERLPPNISHRSRSFSPKKKFDTRIF